ncbi:SixA phosphatase family protein [Polymorphum gilvum]|nr:histidine phosphatase family protein [Polymorphum gilvum]
MLRLLLLRHAKSDWADASLADFDRPLNERGDQSAARMSAYLKAEGLYPDRILCSTALRTRQTLARLLPELHRDAEVSLMRALYDDGELDYIPHIRSRGGNVRTLMVIGHNPATEDTARELVIEGRAEDLHALNEKYPTGALAVIECPTETWAGLTAQTCRLERFVRPRLLET